MKITNIKFTLLFFCFLSVLAVNAQDDFEKKYLLGKDFIAQGKYDPAMEVLKPLTTEDPDNKFIRYAHYYYSLAALKGGRYQEAYNMLFQLINRYPDWEKIDEAYYLIANVSFEQKKYRQALKYLNDVKKKDLKEDIDLMKASYLRKAEVLDTLINIQRDFPEDPVIAKTLARKLVNASELNEKQRMLLEYLIQEFKLDKKEFSPTRESVMKSSYNVAILFPFLLKELETSPGARSNQFVYDLYQGMKLAADSLKKAGITINLLAYDTEKNEQKLSEILNMPEMKSMDLIVGPIYPQSYSTVNQFGLQNQILVINPLSENSALLEDNPFIYLLQPTLRNRAGAAARYAGENFIREIPDEKSKNKKPEAEPALTKQVIIFLSPSSRDSLAAGYYRDSIIAKGFEVKNFEVVSRDSMVKVQNILGDSIGLLKVSHIFVSSTDQVLAANVVSAMEISGFQIPIFTGSEWLQFPLLTYDQYERREIHFLYPDFVEYNKKIVKDFRKRYFRTYNTLPFTNYAYEGYDLMMLFGNALGKYGNYFSEGLAKQGFIPGYMLSGFNYSISRSNSFVPLVKFMDSNLLPVNLPPKIK